MNRFEIIKNEVISILFEYDSKNDFPPMEVDDLVNKLKLIDHEITFKEVKDVLDIFKHQNLIDPVEVAGAGIVAAKISSNGINKYHSINNNIEDIIQLKSPPEEAHIVNKNNRKDKMRKLVFISHASEDKERFVIDFATKLRSKGIDAWVDKWEMLPGDKLVSKIFEEGIKNADVIIIVLSKYSVDKPWVKEEIDASFIKRIENRIKLIPVIIDECEVPECLKSTLFQRILDLNNYEDDFNKIVLSIFNEHRRPSIGTPPKYDKSISYIISGLELVDTLIMKIACEFAMKINDNFIQLKDIIDEIKANDIEKSDLFESLEILERNHYFKKTISGFGGVIDAFFISNYGFEEYAKLYIPDYDAIKVKIISELVNQRPETNLILHKITDIPIFIINRILGLLNDVGYIKMCYEKGEEQYIFEIYPELKRLLKIL